MNTFLSLEDIIASVAGLVKPTERMTVDEAARRYRRLYNPGSYTGPWDNDFAPYLVEPMQELTSLEYTGLIFAGPARTGKSEMFFNWLTHTAVNDPADMMMIHMTRDVARDWSNKDLKRAFRYSPELGDRVMKGRQFQSMHDVVFQSGMHLLIKWPSISELSGKTIPRLWLADYDRMPDDVDGEGSAFNAAQTRAVTFRRYGMTVAESSPGRDITDPKWMPPHPRSHLAPPCGGILSLYNQGDRRRWYWKCPQCDGAFEPDFKLLRYPESKDPVEAGELAYMVCPHCGGILYHNADEAKGLPGKHEMNCTRSMWVKDGCWWEDDGTISGTPARSDIASFWLKGPAAAFADWALLVSEYLKGVAIFEETQKEEALKVAVNTKLGLPYTPKVLLQGRNAEQIKALATDIGERVIPKGVRFLTAAVDIQGYYFVVQVHGYGPSPTGVGYHVTVIDRFSIRKSRRRDDEGDAKRMEPGRFLEDWDILIDEVLLKSYPLADNSGRRMSIIRVACDSGGKDGVTANAYNFWRRLRDAKPEDGIPPGLHNRFRLVKGASHSEAPRITEIMPDTRKKGRFANARGEIPVLSINGNQLKDQVDIFFGGIDEEGNVTGSRVTFPLWLPDWFYAELVAETRTEKGWVNMNRARNEALDCFCYNLAVAIYTPISLERLCQDWDDVPAWADEWDTNDMVFDPRKGKSILEAAQQDDDDTDLEELGRLLA